MRIHGKRAGRENVPMPPVPIHPSIPTVSQQNSAITALPLSADQFEPYGHVAQAYSNPELAPKGTKITSANQGSALKFHKLAPILAFYPDVGETLASLDLSVYRCQPLNYDPVTSPEGWAVRLLERHPFTSQAFIPMGIGSGKDTSLEEAGRAYLVVVAKGGDDGPDLKTLRAFVAGAGQAVVYAPGIWRKSFVSSNISVL